MSRGRTINGPDDVDGEYLAGEMKIRRDDDARAASVNQAFRGGFDRE